MDSTVHTTRARIDATSLDSGLAIISVSGILDSTNFEEADRLVESLYRNGCNRLIVDMAKLKFISSSGIGAFLSYVSSTAEKGGGVVFANVPSDIMKIFDITGLSKLLRFAPNVRDAEVQLGGTPGAPKEETLFFL
jgi:anti-anti-sigma factor